MTLTFDEWKILVKGLKTIYTQERYLPDVEAIKIWYGLLKDLDYNSLNAAIQTWICTNSFPPTVADLRKLCMQQISGDDDWSKAFEDVRYAIRYYGYYRESEALASLPPATAEAARRFGWQALCDMQLDEMQVNRAQFRDIYNSVTVQRQHESVLPEKLRTLIAGVTDRKELNG